MNAEIRQAYLEGFEGGDLKPERARMVEAYVNGVDGQLLENLELCRIGGFNPKDSDSARTIVWKVFTSNDSRHKETYAKEREYMRYLHTENTLRSVWGASEICRRLQKTVLLAQGELAIKQVVGDQVLPVPMYNLAAANQALQLLGKTQGMFADKLEHTGADGKPIEFVRRVEYVGSKHE